MKRFLTTIASVILMLAISLFAVACGGETPSASPSTTPSATPSVTPSVAPSVVPSVVPSTTPSVTPSVAPSVVPSVVPSTTPSVAPSTTPSVIPSAAPSVAPSTGITLTKEEFENALSFAGTSNVTFALTTSEPGVDGAEAEITNYFAQLDGNKICIFSDMNPDFAYVIDSAEDSLYLYFVTNEEEAITLRADLIGMITDPLLAELVNTYLAVDYGAMLLESLASFEDEGFSVQGAMQEIVALCESADYDLKTIVHTLMETYDVDETEVNAMLAELLAATEGVSLEDILLAMELPTDAVDMILTHFEENGFDLDALIDFVVLFGFDLETAITSLDEFLASVDYSLTTLLTIGLESLGITEMTLGEILGAAIGMEPGVAIDYETILAMMDLEGNYASVNWVEFLTVETMFAYEDFTCIGNAYTAEILLDEASGFTVSETLTFNEDKTLASYALSFAMAGETYGMQAAFTDYDETEVVVPTEFIDVTLGTLLGAADPDFTDPWAEMFVLDNYTATIDVSARLMGITNTEHFEIACTEENWKVNIDSFSWKGTTISPFEAYGNYVYSYVNGALDYAAEEILYNYTSIFDLCAYLQLEFEQTGENTFVLDEFDMSESGMTTVMYDLTVSITDGHVSSISYVIEMDLGETVIIQHWQYSITNVGTTVIPSPFLR